MAKEETVTQEVLNANVDKTIQTYEGTHRKPRGIYAYEYNFLNPIVPSFGSAIYQSIIKGFASVFEYDGFPEEIRVPEFEAFLVQSGRMKIIKAGSMFYPVHVVPRKFNHYGDWIETSIIEPYLPGLSGKKTEKFDNVEFKNDVLGQSLIRLIYPFIETIDDALFNLKINQEILAGKYVFITPETTKQGTNKENEDSLSLWITNGKPIKEIAKSLLEDGELPIKKLEVNDATQSFIDTIQFNYNQMLNVLGIPNNNAEGKRERMITSEIDIQNILQSSILEDLLKARQYAVSQFNKLFGTNVSVSIRTELETAQLVGEQVEEEEVGE